MPNVPEDQVVDIKIYGHQWYWRYQYGEGDEITEVESQVPAAGTEHPRGTVVSFRINGAF